MKVVVQKLRPDAKVPTKAYAEDAGFDLYACEECDVRPGEQAIVATGLRFAIPAGFAGFIWDKSGLAAKNSIKTMAGVLDSNYRGELKVVLANLGKDSYRVEKGKKIAQLVIKKVESPEMVEGEIGDETERGTGGFGSSGLT